jgi:predicted Zn-dependent peptidase
VPRPKGRLQVDPARFSCHLLNVVLGSSMSSRLFQEIREKRGLAYSVYSFLNNHKDTGMLGIYAGVSQENVKEALQVIHDQLLLLSKHPITEAELKSAKEYLKGSMYLNAENTDSRMNRLAKNEFLFERYVPFEEVEEQMYRVTAQEIQSWFKEIYTPDEVALLLFGPTDLDEAEARHILSGV